MGGGNAGVICAEMDKVTLEGKELDLVSVQKLLDARWKELQAKYDEDKKKDPDFAIPPNEDQLPKPAPKLIWQQGKDKWHVDASVAVVGDRVLAASSYLDDERIGERKLFCLKTSDGGKLWEAPLRYNPWAGPTVAGSVVLVGSSNIRFDTKLLKAGRGEVAAINLDSGTVKWHKDVAGGVVSPIAVQNNLAVFTATDGKLRAWDVTSGEEKWRRDLGSPAFAGPAIAGGIVYAADLKGVVHAFELADGKPLWTLDLANDPVVKAPGMVYGSPVVHAGWLYVATCNLEGPNARQPTVVVCIGEK